MVLPDISKQLSNKVEWSSTGRSMIYQYRKQRQTTDLIDTRIRIFYFDRFQYLLYYSINNIKKYLDSNWLRAVQFQANAVPKEGNSVICTQSPFFVTMLLFSCILLIVNSVISRTIWKNTHL